MKRQLILSALLLVPMLSVAADEKPLQNPSIYKNVHKPSNIRMPWMLPKAKSNDQLSATSAQESKNPAKQMTETKTAK